MAGLGWAGQGGGKAGLGKAVLGCAGLGRAVHGWARRCMARAESVLGILNGGVLQVKKGPLAETSPMLNDISGVPTWTKVSSCSEQSPEIQEVLLAARQAAQWPRGGCKCTVIKVARQVMCMVRLSLPEPTAATECWG